MGKFDLNEEIDYKDPEEAKYPTEIKRYNCRGNPAFYNKERVECGNWKLYGSSPLSLQLRDISNKIIVSVYLYNLVVDRERCIEIIKANPSYYQFESFMQILNVIDDLLKALTVLVKYKITFRYWNNVTTRER